MGQFQRYSYNLNYLTQGMTEKNKSTSTSNFTNWISEWHYESHKGKLEAHEGYITCPNPKGSIKDRLVFTQFTYNISRQLDNNWFTITLLWDIR